MKIGIEVNNVLRDTLGKIEQVYEKWYIENPYIDESDEKKYEIFSKVTTLDIMSHLKFSDEEQLYTFLYKEYPMEIFGHASSVEFTGMHDLNDLYVELRDNHELIIVSDEIGKSKPATLFFLSKFGCLIENIKFYSESTKNSLWDSIDVLLTSNPKLLLEKPKDKIVIKYETSYNQSIESLYRIKRIKELKEKILLL